jgi:hypothetical protein
LGENVCDRLSSSASIWWPDAQAAENCLVYERQTADQRLLIALNFFGQEQLSLSALGKGKIALSTTLIREGEVDLSNFVLQANEGCIIKL